MKTFNIDEFVNLYEKYYFKLTEEEKKKYQNEMIARGINILNPTSREWETKIENNLKKGILDAYSVAWKFGIVYNGEDNLVVHGYRTYEYSKYELGDFCLRAVQIFYKKDGFEKRFIELSNSEDRPDGFGSVYLINAFFFLSQGAIPVYDYYAHTALKALLYDVNPQMIYCGCPSRDEFSRSKDEDLKNPRKHAMAVNLLNEYQYQLNQLKEMCDEESREKYFGKDGMFITRELDRALWVYGHCKKKYSSEII